METLGNGNPIMIKRDLLAAIADVPDDGDILISPFADSLDLLVVKVDAGQLFDVVSVTTLESGNAVLNLEIDG